MCISLYSSAELFAAAALNMLISLWQKQQGKKNPLSSQQNAAAGSLYVLQSTTQLSWLYLKNLL